MKQNDTIAACATAQGNGAIAIIRLSGPDAISIAAKISTPKALQYESHTLHHTTIYNKQKEPIDSVLLAVMRTPKTYTGEDLAEISCHGGHLVARRVLERALEAGARPAEPGEFTLRAFLNGKIDLAQAEAVQELIAAQNDMALLAAKAQLEGKLSCHILSLQNKLLDIAAQIEAFLDFPDEEIAPPNIRADLELLTNEFNRLLATYHDGRIIKEGAALVLLGTPNVGKSSLMNALLRQQRAIVTPIAGTTRDLLEESLSMGRLHFRLIDTAGIRQTDEIIEQEGINRANRAAKEADRILLILDASRKLNEDDYRLLNERDPEKTLVIWNKTDLAPPPLQIEGAINISATADYGLDKLQAAIEKSLFEHTGNHPLIITQERHKKALEAAADRCGSGLDNLQNNGPQELVAADLRHALSALNAISGKDIPEEILNSIFSKFCIGK